MDYCPFDIVSREDTFGLEARSVPTHYGSIRARVSKTQNSDSATLYIHGVGADWTTWTPMIRAEAACGFRTHDQIFINMPGFGDSDNRLDKLDIADVGDTILSVVATLGYSSVRVVGHSMGGFLTLDMASRRSDRITSIHLIAGPYFSILTSIQHPLLSFGHDPIVAATFGAQYLLARAGRLQTSLLALSYRIGFARALLAPFVTHPSALRDSIVKNLCQQSNPRGLILTAANGDGYEADEQWSKISCPIWAVFADKDNLVPQKDMKRFLRCQPGAHCTTVEDAGHLLHLERPVPVLKSLGLWT